MKKYLLIITLLLISLIGYSQTSVTYSRVKTLDSLVLRANSQTQRMTFPTSRGPGENSFLIQSIKGQMVWCLLSINDSVSKYQDSLYIKYQGPVIGKASAWIKSDTLFIDTTVMRLYSGDGISISGAYPNYTISNTLIQRPPLYDTLPTGDVIIDANNNTFSIENGDVINLQSDNGVDSACWIQVGRDGITIDATSTAGTGEMQLTPTYVNITFDSTIIEGKLRLAHPGYATFADSVYVKDRTTGLVKTYPISSVSADTLKTRIYPSGTITVSGSAPNYTIGIQDSGYLKTTTDIGYGRHTFYGVADTALNAYADMYAVKGYTTATNSRAIYGRGTGTASYGVYGDGVGTASYGVVGYGYWGVAGATTSNTGYSGYFSKSNASGTFAGNILFVSGATTSAGGSNGNLIQIENTQNGSGAKTGNAINYKFMIGASTYYPFVLSKTGTLSIPYVGQSPAADSMYVKDNATGRMMTKLITSGGASSDTSLPTLHGGTGITVSGSRQSPIITSTVTDTLKTRVYGSGNIISTGPAPNYTVSIQDSNYLKTNGDRGYGTYRFDGYIGVNRNASGAKIDVLAPTEIGIQSYAENNIGVQGISVTSEGVKGSGVTGVKGEGSTFGVYGSATDATGIGVYGANTVAAGTAGKFIQNSSVDYTGKVLHVEQVVSNGKTSSSDMVYIKDAEDVTGTSTGKLIRAVFNKGADVDKFTVDKSGNTMIAGTVQIRNSATGTSTDSIQMIEDGVMKSIAGSLIGGVDTLKTRVYGTAPVTVTGSAPAQTISMASASSTVPGYMPSTMFNKIDNDSLKWVLINRCGFVNNTETTIAFDEGTHIFTLGSVGASWRYMRAGNVYTITGSKAIDLDTVTGFADGVTMHIFINNNTGILGASMSDWTLVDSKLPVAQIAWNSTLYPKSFMSDERHTMLQDRRTHLWEHARLSTGVISGGIPSRAATGGTTNQDNCFGVSETVLNDDDLFHTLDSLARPTGANGTGGYEVFYKTAATTWNWDSTDVPFKFTAGGYIQFWNGTAMTQGQNNRYYNSYLLVSNMNGAGRYAIVPGEGEYTSTALAYAEDPRTFNYTNFGLDETVIVYQLTWNTSNTRNQKGKCNLTRQPQRINSTITTTSVSSSTIYTDATMTGNGSIGAPLSVVTSTMNMKADVVSKYWIGVDTTAINTSDVYFIGYSDGMVVDSLIFSLRRVAGSPDVTMKLWYGSDINAAGTALVTAGNQITTYAGATRTGTLNNATIAKGSMIWATFSAVSVRPKGIFVTIKGHDL